MPVRAIGTGKTATPDQVREIHYFIRNLVEQLFGNQVATSIKIIYGGSVKPENIDEIMLLDNVDGALVGGASLDPHIFSRIVNFKAATNTTSA